MGNWNGLVALLLAWIVFATFARGRWRWRQLRKIDNHSPVNGQLVWRWIKLLVKGDPDPGPDTEPDTEPRRGFRLREIDESNTVVEWVKPAADSLPLADPAPNKGPTELDTWIRRSFEEGASYGNVVRQGKQMFRISDASMKRAIKRVRGPRRVRSR